MTIFGHFTIDMSSAISAVTWYCICNSISSSEPVRMVNKRSTRTRKPVVAATVAAPVVRSSSKSSARRSTRLDLDLMMECMEEDLSPAQLKYMEHAQEEHEKVGFTFSRKFCI